MQPNIRSSFGDRGNITIQAMQQIQQDEIIDKMGEQEEAHSAFLNQMEEAINPFAARYATKQKPLRNQSSRVMKMLQSGDKADRLAPIAKLKENADEFQRRNPELKAQVLLLLRDRIKPGDTKEDILRKLAEFYQDVSLADEALEFLLETTDGQLYLTIQEAKNDFNNLYSREIAAGRNMGNIAWRASEKGLGSPSSLRDMYRDITGNQRDSKTLFDEFSKLYNFPELKKVVSFLLHSLGADLKAKGPSIQRGLLHRLITEVRSLQAILGVYNFFQGRMNLISTLFANNNLEIPHQLSFEQLAKQFMAFVGDRYPSADKALQLTTRLGIEKWLIAKIIALSQLRDAIREVSLHQIFKSVQHRDDSYSALIEALEDLEDELEELEEEDKEEEEKADKEEEKY